MRRMRGSSLICTRHKSTTHKPPASLNANTHRDKKVLLSYVLSTLVYSTNWGDIGMQWIVSREYEAFPLPMRDTDGHRGTVMLAFYTTVVVQSTDNLQRARVVLKRTAPVR